MNYKEVRKERKVMAPARSRCGVIAASERGILVVPE
jgi:hypothetical protein